MMLRKLVLILVVGLAASGWGQSVRAAFMTSDMVMIGENVSASDGRAGSKWRNDLPEDTTSFEVTTLRVKLSRYIKGDGPAEIEIALPKAWVSLGVESRTPWQKYDGRKGTKALWFIQKSKTQDLFYFGERQSDDTYAHMWRAPGHIYAPTNVHGGGIPAQIVVATTEGQRSVRPILQLAELFAANAAYDEKRRSFFLGLLQDMDARKSMSTVFEPAMDELEDHLKWVKTRFLLLFPASDEKTLLDSLAVRMTWGVRGLSRQFTDLFLRLPKGSLSAYFPSVAHKDALRLLPVLDWYGARGLFISFRRNPEFKHELTRIGIKRFGEHHRLDVGILECLSAVWNRPDLSPYERSEDGKRVTPADDLSRQIAAAKRLLSQ